MLRRDGHRCVICGDHATQVDHIRPGGDHSLGNLRSLCTPCHGKKSSREGNAEYRRLIAASKKRFRRTEEHPGLLEP